MEKLVSQCLHCQPVAYRPMSPNGCNTVLSNLLRRWLPSASKRQVSKHHRPPRCYRGPLDAIGDRQTYPGELAVAASSPQSLWDITNLSSSLIHANTSRNDRYSQNGNSLVYYPANKSSQQLWHDDTTVGTTKCPLPLRTLLSQSASIYQRPSNSSTFEQQTSKRHFSSSCHHCQLLSHRNMNKLVNNILRRASVSVAEPSHSDTKCDLSQLSQIDYKTAIHLLNQLQTNAQNIQQAIEKEKSSNATKSLEKTTYFLSLMGIEPEDLNRLNVVHVAGTKGKGSTCAFVESILRHQGYKTGFYSSPHLVMARERIRINGEPISEEKFAHYFAQVYTRIGESKSPEVSMPAYFNFMTVMALHIFISEQVDVAILEVGIGGEYDCTNVVPKPVVTGVTSLDLDHCKLLGDKIETIAWQKAGIFKPEVAAFTVRQSVQALHVLQQRAKQKKAPLYVAPSWSLYPFSQSTKLGEVQKINASLAVQLAHYWICKRNHAQHLTPTLLTTEGTFSDVFSLNVNNYATALSTTKWLGRCEVIHLDKVTYFLDAAHTPDSMQNCRDWFGYESAHTRPPVDSKDKLCRVLVFNCTGERDPLQLLSKLNDLAFEVAIFTTNSVYSEKTASSDVANFTVTTQREKEICSNNLRTWSKLNGKVEALKVSCISEAIDAIENRSKSRSIHVLVTGSVHLVGGFIGLIHPHYQNDDASTKL